MKKRISFVLAAAALFAPLVTLAQTSGSQKTLTGVVSDAMCGSTHMMKGKSDAECTRACVKEGSKYALVVGKTVYTLEGREADLDKYAGQKVSLTGVLKDGTVAVQSVAPARQ
jgi:hypothetical protein